MTENNQGLNSQDNSEDNNDVRPSAGADQTSDTVNIQGTTFTREEVEEANKPQPNVIVDKAGGPNIKVNRDNERVSPRANEASDSTDTNTGSIISGAAKGANQS